MKTDYKKLLESLFKEYYLPNKGQGKERCEVKQIICDVLEEIGEKRSIKSIDFCRIAKNPMKHYSFPHYGTQYYFPALERWGPHPNEKIRKAYYRSATEAVQEIMESIGLKDL